MIVIKMGDETMASPFLTRLFKDVLVFRDQLFLFSIHENDKQGARKEFDNKLNPLIESARAARDAGRRLLTSYTGYLSSVASGETIRIEDGNLHVNSTIDDELRANFSQLITHSIIAIKSNLQAILREVLKLDIGFLFQGESEFDQGINYLVATGDIVLANYLETTRKVWLQDLALLRIAIEHSGWVLDRIEFTQRGGRVELIIPKINGIQVNAYVVRLVNRVLVFIENMLVYSMLKFSMPAIYLAEIQKNERDGISPSRFRLIPHGLEDTPPWALIYFEETDFLAQTGNIYPDFI